MDAITINLTSYHIERSAQRNERNFGIGYEVKNGYISKMGGIYRNSFNRNTVYAMLGYAPIHAYGVDIGVFGGLVSGYRSPYAVGIMVEYDVASFKIVPPIRYDGRKTEGFVGFQLKYKLGE